MKKINCEKVKNYLKNNYLLIVLILISTTLHLLALKELGFKYTLNSDDLSYIKSGITFFEEQKIIMHGVISAQVMPGMTYLIAFFCLFLGTGVKLWIGLKIFWILMSLVSIALLYKIINMYSNKYIAFIVSMFMLAPDFIWMDNIILTETPFMLAFLFLIYHSLRYLKEYNNKDFVFIVTWYIIALLFRPLICLYPIFFFIVLLFKKHNLKDLLKKSLIMVGVLVAVLLPWTYRNYKIFNRFLPFGYGSGNALLLGTYQGYGAIPDEELDYVTNVDNKMSEEMNYYRNESKEWNHMSKFYSLEYDKMKAMYRMKEWWNKDKVSMIKAYTIFKPKMLLCSSFYWKSIFGIEENFNIILRKVDLVLFAIASIAILVKRKYLAEFFLIILAYGYHIVSYSISFAYSRYAITLFFLRFIVIGIGMGILFDLFKEKVLKK